MCSEGGERGNWTSQQVIGEIDRLLDLLNKEDLCVVPAESMGDDLKGLTRVGNRIAAENSRRLRRFDKGRALPHRWPCRLRRGCAGSAT